VQDPGLKDYVGYHDFGDPDCPTYTCSASRRMSREGSFWVSLQGVQLGNRGGSSGETDKVGRSAKKRIAND
jgi:hypothetical protein